MVVTAWSWKNPQVSRKLIIGNISIQHLSFIYSKYYNVWLCMSPFLLLKILVWGMAAMNVVALVFAMCSGSSLACLCDSPIITLSFLPVSQHTANICLQPRPSAIECCTVWDFSTSSLIFSGVLVMVQSRRAWLKTSSLLSEARKTLRYKVCGKRQWTGAFEAVSQCSPFTQGRADISVRRWHKKYFWSHVQNLQKERKI